MKPLDKEIIKEAAENHDLIVTAEENVIQRRSRFCLSGSHCRIWWRSPSFASRHSRQVCRNKETILPCLRNAAWITTGIERENTK